MNEHAGIRHCMKLIIMPCTNCAILQMSVTLESQFDLQFHGGKCDDESSEHCDCSHSSQLQQNTLHCGLYDH
jgi:hypothetical protein